MIRRRSDIFAFAIAFRRYGARKSRPGAAGARSGGSVSGGVAGWVGVVIRTWYKTQAKTN